MGNIELEATQRARDASRARQMASFSQELVNRKAADYLHADLPRTKSPNENSHRSQLLLFASTQRRK